MTAKLLYLCALTAALVGLTVLLILHPTSPPQLVETIVGALILALGHGANAVFRDSDSSNPTQPAQPAKDLKP